MNHVIRAAMERQPRQTSRNLNQLFFCVFMRLQNKCNRSRRPETVTWVTGFGDFLEALTLFPLPGSVGMNQLDTPFRLADFSFFFQFFEGAGDHLPGRPQVLGNLAVADIQYSGILDR